MSIPDIRRCKFSTYGYACGKEVIGADICDDHGACVSCGAPAVVGCSFCGQFVCGAPLCPDCTYATDKGPSGAWGFLNHVHLRKGGKLPSQIREEEEAERRLLAAQSACLGEGGVA